MMDQKTRNWLQKEFEHFEAEPEVDLWPAIASRIQASGKVRRKWIAYVSLAASVLVLFGLAWILQTPNISKVGNIVQHIPAADSMKPQQVPSRTPASPQIAQIEVIEHQEVLDLIPQNRQLPTKHAAALVSARAEKEASNTEDLSQITSAKLPIEDAQIVEKPSLEKARLTNIDHLTPSTFIKVVAPTKKHIATVEEKKAKSQIKRIGSKTKLDLNELTLENAIVFVANGLNRLANTPVSISMEEKEGESLKTYSFRLKNFSITRKQYKKIKKQES